MTSSAAVAEFDRPIFIVSTPRSGSTLLFETLERAPRLFSTGTESHQRIEHIPGLSPRDRDWESNRLTAADATPERIAQLRAAFLGDARDRDGQPPTGPFRFIEKTPKNALRIPFLAAAFPDARFVYLYRDPRDTLSSMVEAWLSGKFRTYPGLPGWQGPPWSLLLVPGWRDLRGRNLLEIVARQWTITTLTMLDDLNALPRASITTLDLASLLANPQATVSKLSGALDLDWDIELGSALPRSKTTVSPPAPDKWKRNAELIESVLPLVTEADARARAFLDGKKLVENR